MTAKEKHRAKMISFWGDPENEFISRRNMFTDILKIKGPTFYHHFSPLELCEIESEAEQLRRDRSARQRSEVMQALHTCATESGNVSAAKEFLDRTEGKVPDQANIDLTVSKTIVVRRSTRDGVDD